jgi:hypothetical protein
MNDLMTLSQKADALEEKMARELDYIVVKSRIYQLAEGDMGPPANPAEARKKNPDARVLMGDDPRLPAMPEKPTLMDFFKYRFGPSMHLLQSARHAVKANLPEKMVLACLLHDISTAGFIRGDHGYWGAQLVEPYVDPEVTWAIRAHQVLRFYPDESVGYEYPQSYITGFGEDYRPDPYIQTTTSGCGTTNGTCRAGRSPSTTSTRSIPTCMSNWRNSRTLSTATSSSRNKAPVLTTARSRICGGR